MSLRKVSSCYLVRTTVTSYLHGSVTSNLAATPFHSLEANEAKNTKKQESINSSALKTSYAGQLYKAPRLLQSTDTRDSFNKYYIFKKKLHHVNNYMLFFVKQHLSVVTCVLLLDYVKHLPSSCE